MKRYIYFPIILVLTIFVFQKEVIAQQYQQYLESDQNYRIYNQYCFFDQNCTDSLLTAIITNDGMADYRKEKIQNLTTFTSERVYLMFNLS